ncbi:MAG TPA: IPT/TIG domain-containing protein [Bacteroidales bacterium]|nr:IPT/TIG domain-containing protein [Bacteroidales bacterium]
MKSGISNIVIISSFLFLVVTSCAKIVRESYPFPRVRTTSIEITGYGAKFTGNIEDMGDSPISERGFVWSILENPDVSVDEKVYLGPAENIGSFTGDITSCLYEGTTYFVRAFAVNEGYVNYGETLKFISIGSTGPLPDHFSPTYASPGNELVISGHNFSYVPFRNTVLLNNEIKANAFASTDTTVSVKLPTGLPPGRYTVTLEVADVVKMVPGTLEIGN